MKIKIDTKFNIGDVVYTPEFYDVYFASKTPHTITDIFVKASHNQNVAVTYRIIQGQLTDVVSEKFLFATYEECRQWCDEQQ